MTARNPSLYTEIRIIWKVCAQEVKCKILPLQHEGRTCALYGESAVHPVRYRRTAIDCKRIAFLSASRNAEICVHNPLCTIRQWEICLRTQTAELHAICHKVPRIGIVARVKGACTGNRTPECLRLQLIHCNDTPVERNLCRRFLKRYAIGTSRRCLYMSCHQRCRRSTGYMHISCHLPDIGTGVQHTVNSKICRPHGKVQRRCLHIQTNGAIHARRLSPCRQCCCKEKFLLAERECSTL